MSQEGFVLSNRTLSTQAQWQERISALGFDLTLQSTQDIQERHGHLPAIWNGREAGFECGPTNLAEIVEIYRAINLRGPWTYAFAFHWTTFGGCAGAWIAMTAYAEATDGVVFDPQDGKTLTAKAAMRAARQIEMDFPRVEAMVNQTRP